MQNDLRRFRKALYLAIDAVEQAIAERPKDLKLVTAEADIKLAFDGTNMTIRSHPKIEAGGPEPTMTATVV